MAEANKEQSLWQRLLAQERKKLLALLLAVACGVVLLAYPYGSAAATVAQPRAEAAAISAEAQLEARLQRVLQQIEGVGAVEVAVSFCSSGTAEYVLAEQVSSNGQNASRSTELALSGSQPVLVRQSAPELRGVVVVASGAADPQVKERIYAALMAMLDLQITQIAVVEGKAKEAENE